MPGGHHTAKRRAREQANLSGSCDARHLKSLIVLSFQVFRPWIARAEEDVLGRTSTSQSHVLPASSATGQCCSRATYGSTGPASVCRVPVVATSASAPRPTRTHHPPRGAILSRRVSSHHPRRLARRSMGPSVDNLHALESERPGGYPKRTQAGAELQPRGRCRFLRSFNPATMDAQTTLSVGGVAVDASVLVSLGGGVERGPCRPFAPVATPT